ncbi:MAG: helix-turn-helix transcriptional regulator [Clostridia bacterium]|nr:helix-turn-helix transcriptional regulator [Clostridia bacterium]
MQNKETFNLTVATNIARYRKRAGLTQLALAEKLNYSDKAVAKWESGESLPEAFVLYQIANVFGITFNDLISSKKRMKTPINKIRAFFVPALSCCIVWLVALIVFISLITLCPNFSSPWLAFVYAIPVSLIITLIFSCVYKNRLIQFISISGIIWTVILCLHLSLAPILPKVTFLYLLGIPVELAFVLWYAYLQIIKSKTKNK